MKSINQLNKRVSNLEAREPEVDNGPTHIYLTAPVHNGIVTEPVLFWVHPDYEGEDVPPLIDTAEDSRK